MLMWIDRTVRASLFVVPIGFGLIALALGQDADWDIRNYHWYNPYAFLSGRLGIDLGVAHVATFYNPLLDVPIYLLGRTLSAPVMGALLGFVHGLNFIPLYSLAACCLDALVPQWLPVTRRAAAAVLGLVGVLGGGHLGLVGTVYNDNFVSLAVLGSAGIVVRRGESLFAASPLMPTARDLWMTAGAGALVGLAAGLKLPTAIFAVGLCGAFLFVGGGLGRRLALAFVFGLGVTFAFVIADGAWMWRLWRDYANPLFPYFNNVFHSPMGVPDTYRDARFIPNSVLEYLAFPVLFSIDPLRVGEIPFVDYRIVAAYIALLTTGMLAVVGRRYRIHDGGLPPVCGYLIATAVITFVVWMRLFGIYRYIVALEMLAPLLVAIAVMRWRYPQRIKVGIIAAILVVLVVSTKRADWTHYPWQPGPFVSASAPAVPDPDRTLVVITGNDPVGWLVPFFPPQIPFIRLQGFLNDPEQPPNGLNARARAALEAHDGDLFLLMPVKEAANAQRVLRAYSLTAAWSTCRPIPSNLGDYARWCRVYRTSQSVPRPSE
jgi:hypothetical protein